jgi:hypothetical protein
MFTKQQFAFRFYVLRATYAAHPTQYLPMHCSPSPSPINDVSLHPPPQRCPQQSIAHSSKRAP